jgi:ribosome recycling factor
MNPRRRRDPALDELIEEITVDCYDEDEQLTAFETAFDEATLPCPGTIIGQDIDVLSIATEQGRRELIATCRHAGQRYKIALLDIDLHADPTTTRLLAAYRQWTGATPET